MNPSHKPSHKKSESAKLKKRKCSFAIKLKRVAIIFIGIVLIFSFASIVKIFHTAYSIFSGRCIEIRDIQAGSINVHEHVQNEESASKLLAVMDELNISATLLLGSPEATLYLNRNGFTGYDENNKLAINLSKKYPGRFIPFCTIDVHNSDKFEEFKTYLNEGCIGLKLYSGHSMFYSLPLNDSSMDNIYEYCEKHRLPVVFHVNFYKFGAEFEDVLNKYPELIVDCPHFCLISSNLSLLSELMQKHPNLYTDISFGFYAQDGFKRVSGNAKEFSKFLTEHQERVMFGTDMVITDNQRKSNSYISNLTHCYMGMLEEEQYGCFVADEIMGYFNGANLNRSVLDKIYSRNAEIFLGWIAR